MTQLSIWLAQLHGLQQAFTLSNSSSPRLCLESGAACARSALRARTVPALPLQFCICSW